MFTVFLFKVFPINITVREHYFDQFLYRLGLLYSSFSCFRILRLSASRGSNFGSYLLADLG